MNPPFFSFIIPTLQSERFLPACLRSIRRQQYDPARYEILIADGGSTDATVSIARDFGATVLDARGLLAEAAKHRALGQARGDYIALVDTDNELVSPNWMSRVAAALTAHPEALGFESFYAKRPGSPRLNRYLTALLQISDPIARTVAGSLSLLSTDPDGTQVFRLPADGSYPTGANGFVFHRRFLERAPPDIPFHEASFFPALIRAGHNLLLKREDCQIYHDYTDGWMPFLRKRRRMAIHYLLRQKEAPDTWDSRRSPLTLPLAFLFHATGAGPLAWGIAQAIRHRDPDWLIAPAVSFWSCLGTGIGVLDYRRARDAVARKKLSMKLNAGAEARTVPEERGVGS